MFQCVQCVGFGPKRNSLLHRIIWERNECAQGELFPSKIVGWKRQRDTDKQSS